MTATTTRISAVLVLAAAFTASAQAEYRCGSAPIGLDKRACAAAEQGPAALRRFVYSWDRQMASLRFSDYVDANTQRAWEAKAKLARQQNTEASVKVASNTPR
jgi:hypothetical protein